MYGEYRYDALSRRALVRSRREKLCPKSTDSECRSYIDRPGEGRWWITRFRPMFDPEGVPWWSMTVEYRVSEYQQAFETLRRVPGLRFVSVASEEGLEFDATPVNPGTFPWKHFRLIRAAVRDDTGRWVDKSGPASTMQQ